ncbi:glycosyltransferase family 39 protein [Spirulina sp. CCNP1310]|uniref:ArnT family glycosyltransferase n=1 Tax=Spirulina sp. CCNP1310 TaxID=3110249 RepID=UPI002B1FBA53|nr:glycosyltransferase family 39 protein [Spirulina sp. CCNP1310]MEA5418089.1 glycosyltransferase family 39 protein [Spirulina sp. CCNP1310]
MLSFGKILGVSLSKTEWRWLGGLTVAALFLWLVGLGTAPLRDWDEGTYGLVAREMVRSHHWLHLSLFGQPFWAKPPLGIWLVAIGYQVLQGFGAEWQSPALEFACRAPLAIITALGVPLLYLLGRELFGNQRRAIAAAVVYLTLLPVVRHGRLAMLDGIINTFLIFFLLCLVKSKQRPPWAFGMGIALAAIALTKGVLVLALGAIALGYILLQQQWQVFKNPYSWGGLLIGGAVVGAWYEAQWQAYGGEFMTAHFGGQSLDRLSTAVEGNAGPIWYYLLELLKYGWPWLVFFPKALTQAAQQWRKGGLLPLWGFGFFFALVSVMGTKLPWYVFPVYSFFALLIGGYGLTNIAPKLRYFFGFLTLASLGGGAYLLWSDPQIPLIGGVAIALITFALCTRCLSRPNPDRHFLITLSIGLYLGLTSFFLSPAWVWEVNESFPVRAIGAMVREHTSPDTVVYLGYFASRPSLDFYGDRLFIPADLPTLQTLHTQHFILIDEPTRATWGESLEIVASADGYHLIAPKTQL